MTNRSRHAASLVDGESVFRSDDGVITQLSAESFPVLSGMSIKRIRLEPGAIREPQWNVNANQLAYVTTGRVLVSMLGNVDAFSSFVVGAGEMYHVESGAVYHIENVGDGPAEIIAALRTERPVHFGLLDSFNAMTDAVLGNAYDLDASAFEVFDRAGSSQVVRRDGPAHIPENAGFPNAHLFDIEGEVAPLDYSYGTARFARSQYWAALTDISMYSLTVTGKGMREPHWHPVTAELGYVASGHARMRVLDPDGSLDEFVLAPGDAYFIPRAYPHHIEALGDDGIHFLIFFDQPMPGDIGYRATASAFSREVLAASFRIPEAKLPQFPFTPIDPLIVARRNPRDPVVE